MKIDFNANLKDLEGKNIPDSNMGKILGNSLIGETKVSGLDVIEVLDIAQSAYKGVVDFTVKQRDAIKEWIKTNEKLPIITKGNLLKLIEAKENSKKDEKGT